MKDHHNYECLMTEITELADLYLIEPPDIDCRRGRPAKRQRTDSNQPERDIDPLEKYKKNIQRHFRLLHKSHVREVFGRKLQAVDFHL
jgi:hypothetical protein